MIYACTMQTMAAPERGQATAEVVDVLMGVGRRFRRRGADDTIDPGSFWLLRVLVGEGPTRVTDLAAVCGLDVSTVSRHLAQLHRAGLVERTRDPDDRRAQRVQVSPAGRTEVDESLDRRRALLDRSLRRWTDDEVADLHRLMTRMLTDLESTEEGPDHHDR